MRNSHFVSHLVSHFVRFSVLVYILDEVRDKVRDEVFIYFAIVCERLIMSNIPAFADWQAEAAQKRVRKGSPNALRQYRTSRKRRPLKTISTMSYR